MWQKRATTIAATASAMCIVFSIVRAGFLWPIKQEARFSAIEASQSNMVSRMDEFSYKQDIQHDLLIRIEERLWPGAGHASINKSDRGNN